MSTNVRVTVLKALSPNFPCLGDIVAIQEGNYFFYARISHIWVDTMQMQIVSGGTVSGMISMGEYYRGF